MNALVKGLICGGLGLLIIILGGFLVINPVRAIEIEYKLNLFSRYYSPVNTTPIYLFAARLFGVALILFGISLISEGAFDFNIIEWRHVNQSGP